MVCLLDGTALEDQFPIATMGIGQKPIATLGEPSINQPKYFIVGIHLFLPNMHHALAYCYHQIATTVVPSKILSW